MSRNRHLPLLGSVVALVVACQFEPQTPALVHALNEKEIAKNDRLAADAGGRAHLEGALEFLFGTPQEPSYAVLPKWADDEFVPADWGYDALAEEARVAGNEVAFAQQLERIETGTWADLDHLREPLYAEDLWARWMELREEVPMREVEGADGEPLSVEDPDGELFTDDDGNPVSWREEALYVWRHWYPTLRTSASMYRTQCFHCHGASGGGDGSTSRFLNPLPRDYRHGTFKFTALDNKARPRHADLMRILREGVYTTAMPSFRRFSDAQLSGLADYVRLLAIRGETERLMIADYDPDEGIHFENLQENYELVVDRWRAAGDEVIVFEEEVPHSTPERIARGRDLYMRDNAANCVKCHGLLGRGDGESVKNKPEDATDDWGEPILPRDLTSGVYRLGRRPIDLYRRIYAGINGTPMPKHFGMQIVDGQGETRNMMEEDIWDLVFYARSLAVKEPHADPAGAEHAEDEEGH